VSWTRLGLVALLALLAAFAFSCKSTNKTTGPLPGPPTAPQQLYALQPTLQTAITLRWSYSASDIQGFRVYQSLDSTTAFTRVDSISATPLVLQVTVDSLQAGTTYYFFVTAYNQYGESDSSNVLAARTAPYQGVTPPTQLRAVQQEGTTFVQLTWQSAGTQDSFLVQRHDTLNTSWAEIASLGGTITSYADSSIQFSTRYYYRVGAKNAGGSAFGDSVGITTLSPGAPAAPESLRAEVRLHTGVVLTWINLSHTADGIVVFRQLSGFGDVILDTLGPTITTYTDSLGEAFGLYYYKVRVFNSFGHSNFSNIATADYREHSPGIIPLALGNFWNYDVDSAGSTLSERRSVDATLSAGGQDYFLITQSNGSRVDSLYYLRNDSLAAGCEMLHWPHLQAEQPQLLFKYPDSQVNDSSMVDGLPVKILVAQPGENKVVNGHVYDHVIAYDWYVTRTQWMRFYIRPETVGIIQEEHYTGTVQNAVLHSTWTLVTYNVQ